jgi:hypothetical protein
VVATVPNALVVGADQNDDTEEFAVTVFVTLLIHDVMMELFAADGSR